VKSWLSYTLLIIVGLATQPSRGEQITVAVAANFALPMERLETLFENVTQHELIAVSGSTGQLYAQILNGAPYDIFLAADRERPNKLIQNGSAVAGTQFTYALGQLSLWTRDPLLANNLSLDILASSNFRRLAIANPLLAPYGIAAQQTLDTMGLWQALQIKIVRGESVNQAFAMVETRNAELGLVALSNTIAYTNLAASVLVPPGYYAPIRQDAILLTRGEQNSAALAFIHFLRNTEAREIIRDAGYSLP
jgi:molybdate transport system substrate-binding protein